MAANWITAGVWTVFPHVSIATFDGSLHPSFPVTLRGGIGPVWVTSKLSMGAMMIEELEPMPSTRIVQQSVMPKSSAPVALTSAFPRKDIAA